MGLYRHIVLAYDGTVEGRRALREGALLAKRCKAQVHLLSVVAETSGARIADGVYAGATDPEHDQQLAILREGEALLKEIGFKATAKLVFGEPAKQIGAYARSVNADLVVVGHRKKTLISRWWSGSSGAYIVDNTSCSVLISRAEISDADFFREMGLEEAADASLLSAGVA